MTKEALRQLGTFFLLNLTYDLGCLTVQLGDGADRPLLEVLFTPPRAFRCYTESDYGDYLKEFNGRMLVDTTDTGCGVELSDHTPYLLDYRAHMRPQESEETFSCLIRTPDHCVEVICFEEPALKYL